MQIRSRVGLVKIRRKNSEGHQASSCTHHDLAGAIDGAAASDKFSGCPAAKERSKRRAEIGSPLKDADVLERDDGHLSDRSAATACRATRSDRRQNAPAEWPTVCL